MESVSVRVPTRDSRAAPRNFNGNLLGACICVCARERVEGLPVWPHKVLRHVRLPPVRLYLGDLLGDERANRRRQLEAVAREAVARPQAADPGLSDHRVHIILVDGVHGREADDLTFARQRRQPVEEAVQVVLLYVGVKRCVIDVGVDDLALEAMVYRSKYELVVGGSRHEVDAGGPPPVGNEGELAELLWDPLVAYLDARRKCGGGKVDARGGVELVEPRARGVDDDG
eukprot:scaffold44705_cov24-Tisochrysis_lutea.AAC.3